MNKQILSSFVGVILAVIVIAASHMVISPLRTFNAMDVPTVTGTGGDRTNQERDRFLTASPTDSAEPLLKHLDRFLSFGFVVNDSNGVSTRKFDRLRGMPTGKCAAPFVEIGPDDVVSLRMISKMGFSRAIDGLPATYIQQGQMTPWNTKRTSCDGSTQANSRQDLDDFLGSYRDATMCYGAVISARGGSWGAVIQAWEQLKRRGFDVYFSTEGAPKNCVEPHVMKPPIQAP